MGGTSFFLSVELKDPNGALVSSVLYPIGVSKSGNLNEYTNLFSDMNKMPEVPIKETFAKGDMTEHMSGTSIGTFTLSNPEVKLGYFIRLRMLEESDSLRTTYSDNYISLLPGESKSISVYVGTSPNGKIPETLHFEVSGWNVPAKTIEVKTGG
jgi:hypothetical protein